MDARPQPLSSARLRILGIAVTAILGLAPARAQIFAGVAPLPAVPTPSVAAPPATMLRPMPSIAADLKISGENGDLRWPVYVTEAQSRAPLRVQIGFLSAVSILPDDSTLTIAVNGTPVGVQTIDASQSVKAVQFDVPAGALSAGMNAIGVTMRQRHRVDCSVAATYELWTRIDPRRTGLIVPTALAGIASFDDIAALVPKPDGSMPIHIVLHGKTNPRHLERLIRATQAVALTGHFTQPAVDFAATPGDPSGVDLVLGTRTALAKLPRVAGRLGESGPLATVLPATDTARPMILVTGSTDADVDQALDLLGARRDASGTRAGLLAAKAADGYPTSGGEALTLHDVGLASQQFDGRFFHQGFDLALPADILASDYGRGTFDLAGAYAEGLAPGAQVRVDVNGQSAGLIKLPDAQGDVFRHNQLFMPLRLLRPGRNHVDIYAETPRPADASCAAPAARRFLLLDTSVFKLPTLAHVVRLPDLAVTASGALPYATGHAHLVVPKPDRDTMSAALSLATRVAVAAGRPVPFAFSTSIDGDGGSTLVVSPARALDPDLMRRTGLDPADVETAWQGLAPAPDVKTSPAAGLAPRWWLANAEAPLACRLPNRTVDKAAPKFSPPPVPAAAAPTTADDGDLLAAWTGDAKRPTWQDRLSAASMDVMAWVDRLGSKFSVRPASPAAGIAPGTSLILAQGFSARSGTDVTTIVTAPDAATLKDAVACLFDRSVWPAVHGRLVTLDASSGHVAATDATQFRYAASGAPSLRNMRLVAAGWLSVNPVAFVIIALALAAILSGTTPLFVRRIGRRSE